MRWSGAAPPWCAYISFDVVIFNFKKHNFTLILQPLSGFSSRGGAKAMIGGAKTIVVLWYMYFYDTFVKACTPETFWIFKIDYNVFV